MKQDDLISKQSFFNKWVGWRNWFDGLFSHSIVTADYLDRQTDIILIGYKERLVSSLHIDARWLNRVLNLFMRPKLHNTWWCFARRIWLTKGWASFGWVRSAPVKARRRAINSQLCLLLLQLPSGLRWRLTAAYLAVMVHSWNLCRESLCSSVFKWFTLFSFLVGFKANKHTEMSLHMADSLCS